MSEFTKTFFYSMAADVCLITDNREREKVACNIGKKLNQKNKKFNWDKWLDACNVKRQKGLASHVPPILHQSGQTLKEAGYKNHC